MFTVSFWKGAAERAVRAAAGSVITLWTADVPLNLFDIDPGVTAGIAAGAAVLSVLTSLVSVPVSGGDSSSFVPGAR